MQLIPDMFSMKFVRNKPFIILFGILGENPKPELFQLNLDIRDDS